MLWAGCEFGWGVFTGLRAELCHGFFGKVPASGGLPFVVHVSENSAGEADSRGGLEEDPHNSRPAFYFLADALQRVGVPDLLPVSLEEPGKARTSSLAWSINGPILAKLSLNRLRTAHQTLDAAFADG